jgi:hypothetical protein
MTFLGHDPADASHKWPEWALQAYVIQEARRAGYLVTGDMAQGKRNPGKAKSQGLLAGHPDLSFWLPGGIVVMIELKTKDGVLSQAQKHHQEDLKDLDHYVHNVYGTCPSNTWDQCLLILKEYSNDI